MKLYLLAGGLLITAASVYGITDYMNTKNKKEFKNLYKEAPVTLKENVKLQDVKEEDFSRGKLQSYSPPKEDKQAVAVKKRKVKAKNKTAIEPVVQKPEIEIIHVIEEVKAPANTPEITAPHVIKEKKPLKKKLNSKMFSRGAIREEAVAKDSIVLKKN